MTETQIAVKAVLLKQADKAVAELNENKNKPHGDAEYWQKITEGALYALRGVAVEFELYDADKQIRSKIEEIMK